jgi:diguanylate cyclase (GGDEF)-like protein
LLDAAAEDRRHAAEDRRQAAEDRRRTRMEREEAERDELTGALGRRAGLIALQREIARARRSSEALVVAFVDVDGLKAVNDRQGHAAGDALLENVVVSLRSGLRAYDVVVRYAGDEFLCALSGAEAEEAAARFDECAGILSALTGASVSIGLAELRDGETLEGLIARADAALYAARRRVRQGRGADP